MPSLGADMETGTLLEWRVRVGDAVRRGDIVALVDTDKANIEVEIFFDGTVEALLVEPGRKVPVGTALALVRTAGEAPAGATAPQVAAAPAPPPKPATPAAAPRPTAPPPPPLRDAPQRVHASPLARRLAAERGIDLATLHGSGPDGAIVRQDVLHAAGAAPQPPSRAGERSQALRRSLAAAMARSKREIPHYYLATRIDADRLSRWLEAENRRLPVTERILPAALLLKATALALRQVPELNGTFQEGAFHPSEAIHLGIAISLRPSGLVAAALRDADRRTPIELMAALRDLVRRARAGVLRSSELSDATVTVTNLGDQGVDAVFGVIHPPQVAIVGFGRIREEPWAAEGMVGVRPVVTATLAADHRASDGHRGGLFLSAVERLLQTPEAL